MAEYIEREAALKTLCEEGCCEYDPNAPCGCNEWLAISAIPAADVAPVVHGEWVERVIQRSDPDGDWLALEYRCSLCGRVEYRKEPYCHCGAKMRERKGDYDD